MATALKTSHIASPRCYTVVRLSAEILCLPSPASFVTICFAFRSRILPNQPCEIPTSVRGRKARAVSARSSRSVFEIGTSSVFTVLQSRSRSSVYRVSYIRDTRSCARVQSFRISTSLACTNYTAKLSAEFGRASLKEDSQRFGASAPQSFDGA